MKSFTLKDPKYLPPQSEADEQKYGKAYWSYTHDSDTPVMFNLMEGEVGDGSVVEAETIEVKESKKGTEYHRLKKVRVTGAAQITSNRKSNDELILEKLDKILAYLEPNNTPQQPEEKPITSAVEDQKKPIDFDKPVTADDFEFGDEPVDLSEIPF